MYRADEKKQRTSRLTVIVPFDCRFMMDYFKFYFQHNSNVVLLIASGFILAISYSFGLALYRLTLDPLAKFPGPKLAAATYWYEFYFDWWCGGKYIFEIEKMHKTYGT